MVTLSGPSGSWIITMSGHVCRPSAFWRVHTHLTWLNRSDIPLAERLRPLVLRFLTMYHSKNQFFPINSEKMFSSRELRWLKPIDYRVITIAPRSFQFVSCINVINLVEEFTSNLLLYLQWATAKMNNPPSFFFMAAWDVVKQGEANSKDFTTLVGIRLPQSHNAMRSQNLRRVAVVQMSSHLCSCHIVW